MSEWEDNEPMESPGDEWGIETISKDEITRKAMLRTIDLLWAQETVPWKDVKAIIALIERGKPKVSREFVTQEIKYIAEYPSQHRLEAVLNRAGVEVEDGSTVAYTPDKITAQQIQDMIERVRFGLEADNE